MQHFATLRDDLLAIPGVAEVGYSSRTPLRGDSVETTIEIDGRPADPDSPMQVEFRRASPEFFAEPADQTVTVRLMNNQDLRLTFTGDPWPPSPTGSIL